jgi:tight adherence protein C
VTQLVVLCAVIMWFGATLVLADRGWFARRSLTDRLGPYQIGARSPSRRSGAFSVASVHDVLGPLCTDVGARLSRALGVTESLADRLARIHSPLDATGFRLRQLGWSALGLFGAAVVCVAGMLGAALAAALLLLTPAITFVVIEQRLANRSARRQRTIQLELPVVSEQLGMLLSSGWSLGAALQRLSRRGAGAVAQDLQRVCARVGHGVSERQALAEWDQLAAVDGVHRLVAVLALNSETTDLGRMISEEARSIRAESHRALLATLDKRAQMVWIPVTVATLIPGVIFLSIPFIEVMRVFSTH